MNAIAIILGIVIIILVFVLYQYFSTTATMMQSSLVNLQTPPAAITTIASPTNNQYSYGIWVYVNNWDQGTNKVIFNHKGAMTIYLMNNQPSLVVDVQMSGDNSLTTSSTIITNNFPLQKWVFIIASMDNQFLDVYLDGKLVKSAKLTNSANTAYPTVPSSTPNVYLGNNSAGDPLYNGVSGSSSLSSKKSATSDPFNSYVTYFYRWITPMDPGTAWKYYMKGNGQNTALGSMSNYGVQMQVTQNNVVASSYKLF
jgi:hypothetical protein